MLDIETGKIKEFVKNDLGSLVIVTGGHNAGRVGKIVHKEKHKVGRRDGGRGKENLVGF